jgi:hypothetical protein
MLHGSSEGQIPSLTLIPTCASDPLLASRSVNCRGDRISAAQPLFLAHLPHHFRASERLGTVW